MTTSPWTHLHGLPPVPPVARRHADTLAEARRAARRRRAGERAARRRARAVP